MGKVFIIVCSTNDKQIIITIANRSMHAGGSCGYGDVVSQPPFSSMVTAVGPSLYKSGTECGACYQVYIYNDLSIHVIFINLKKQTCASRSGLRQFVFSLSMREIKS